MFRYAVDLAQDNPQRAREELPRWLAKIAFLVSSPSPATLSIALAKEDEEVVAMLSAFRLACREEGDCQPLTEFTDALFDIASSHDDLGPRSNLADKCLRTIHGVPSKSWIDKVLSSGTEDNVMTRIVQGVVLSQAEIDDEYCSALTRNFLSQNVENAQAVLRQAKGVSDDVRAEMAMEFIRTRVENENTVGESIYLIAARSDAQRDKLLTLIQDMRDASIFFRYAPFPVGGRMALTPLFGGLGRPLRA